MIPEVKIDPNFPKDVLALTYKIKSTLQLCDEAFLARMESFEGWVKRCVVVRNVGKPTKSE